MFYQAILYYFYFHLYFGFRNQSLVEIRDIKYNFVKYKIFMKKIN